MSRILINHRTGPFGIAKEDIQKDRIWICGCGLTSTPPYCDSSHATARKEAPESLVYYENNDDANPPVPVDPALFRRSEDAAP